MVAGMTSCSNEEIVSPAAEGHTAKLTVNITKPGYDAQTRTELSEVEGSLKCVWSEGDKVFVTNGEGANVGVLTLLTGAGEETATFSGELTGVANGSQDLNFFYLGKEFKGEKPSFPVEFDFSNQTGEFENLSDYDFLSSTATVNVAEGDAYTKDMGLARYISFAHFTVSYGEGVTAEEGFDLAGQNLYNKVAIDGTGNITVTKGNVAVAKNDMYIVVVPSNVDGEQTSFNFEKTVDDVDYSAELGLRTWKNSEFVRLAHTQGIAVEMKAVANTTYNVLYNANNNSGDVQTVPYNNMPSKFTFKVGDQAEEPEWVDHVFKGWSNTANGTEDLTGTDVTLTKANPRAEYYAIWEHADYTFTLTYDANKPAETTSTVTGTPAKESKTVKATSYDFTIASANMVCGNYEFLGWSYNKDAKEADLKAGDVVKATKAEPNKTVYAIWKKQNIGGGAPGAGGTGY